MRFTSIREQRLTVGGESGEGEGEGKERQADEVTDVELD